MLVRRIFHPSTRFPHLAIALAVALQSCLSLAPAYDEKLVEGLQDTSSEIMELLSITTDGTDESTYAEREERYHTVIGKVDALQLQVNARPMPKGKALKKVNAMFVKKGFAPVTDTAPSVTALENISKNLVMMRSTDKKQGLTPTETKAFRNNIVLYLDQALTYERFLER